MVGTGSGTGIRIDGDTVQIIGATLSKFTTAFSTTATPQNVALHDFRITDASAFAPSASASVKVYSGLGTDGLGNQAPGTIPEFTLTDEEVARINAGALYEPDSIEPGYNLQQAMRAILATQTGLVSGADQNAPVFTDVNQRGARVTAQTTGAGNRTAVTINVDDIP